MAERSNAGMTPDSTALELIMLDDGRRLACRELGDRAGAPVLYCHGFPGSRLEAGFAAEPARATGVRLLAPDRPGFGRSDPRDDFALDEWAEDVIELLERLDIGRTGLLGVSGGAPYALGCAARYPERVTAVALIGPLGPVTDAPGTDGMSPLVRFSFHLARHRPHVQSLLFRCIAAGIRMSPGRAFRLLTGGLAPADLAIFEQAGMRRIWIDSLRASVDQGAAAAVAEMRRYARPWPFDLAAIETTVSISHGCDDRVVPPAHGRWLARHLPRVEAHWPRHEGHFSLPVNAVRDRLEWLRRAEELHPR